MNAPQDFREMTAGTVGRDLLQALLLEIKLMPEVWQKMSKAKQDDVIDRLRDRVDSNIKMAVHLLAAQGRITIAADLDQVVRKDGIKAVFKINSNAEGRHELFDSEGKACLIIVADAGDHTSGMDDIQGEADQRAMDLGHEYHDNDGGGMPDTTSGGEVIEGKFFFPSPEQVKPTWEQMISAYADGYAAAEGGFTKNDCPILSSELVIEWLRGFASYDRPDYAGPVAYHHPRKDGQTWNGRDRKPAWMQEWMHLGGTMEQLAFEVDSTEPEEEPQMEIE